MSKTVSLADHAIASIVKKIVNIDATAETNLLSEGLTSIGTIRLFNAVEREFGRRPDISLFYQNPTIGEIKRNLIPQSAPFVEPPHYPTTKTAFGWTRGHTITDGLERDAFANSVRSRHIAPRAVALPHNSIEEKFYTDRSSVRRFGLSQIAPSVLGGLLESISHTAALDSLPSAFSTLVSSIELFVHVRPNKVHHVAPGLYKYDIVSHELVLVIGDIDLGSEIHKGNINDALADSAACTFFLTIPSENSALSSETVAYKSALLGAGFLGQILSQEATRHGVKITPLHGYKFQNIKWLFDDDRGTATLLHLLVCGAPREADPIPVEKDNAKDCVKTHPSNIVVVERAAPLLPGQERLLSTEYRLDDGTWPSSALETNLRPVDTYAVKIEGHLNVLALEQAIAVLIDRHSALRTVFRHNRHGLPLQVTACSIPFRLSIENMTDFQDADAIELERVFGRFKVSPEQPELFSVKLLKWDVHKHALIIHIHHLISDGWSASIIFRELSVLYHCFHLSQKPELSPLDYTIEDHAEAMERARSEGAFASQTAFWIETLSRKTVPQRTLPPRYPSDRGVICDFPIFLPKELLVRLRHLSANSDFPGGLSGPILSALAILLYEMHSVPQINIGLMVPARTNEKTENIIGFLANRIIFRSDIDPALQISDLISKANRTVALAMQNQDVPIQDVLHELRRLNKIDTDQGAYEDSLALNELTNEQIHFPDLVCSDAYISEKVHCEAPRQGSTKVKLRWLLDERFDGIRGIVEYSREHYSEEDMRIITGTLSNILSELANNRGSVEELIHSTNTLSMQNLGYRTTEEQIVT